MQTETEFAYGKRVIVNIVNIQADPGHADITRIKEMVLTELSSRLAVSKQKKKQGHNGKLSDEKYLDLKEIRMLLAYAEQEKETALRRNRLTPVWKWFFIQTALNTGLRISEIADLRCRDYYIKNNIFTVKVRNGKGGKEGKVLCSDSFKKKWFWFLEWKKQNSYPVEDDAPLFYSKTTGRSLTTRTFQKALKTAM